MKTIKKLWRIYTILFLIAVIFIVFHFIKNIHFCPKGTIWTGSQCNGTGIKIDNFVKGEILVSFNDRTTYINAKKLLKDLGFNIKNTNSYWSKDFEPTDEAKLKTIDLFKIKVPSGDEDRIVNELKKFPIVRGVSKNQIMRVNQ